MECILSNEIAPRQFGLKRPLHFNWNIDLKVQVPHSSIIVASSQWNAFRLPTAISSENSKRLSQAQKENELSSSSRPLMVDRGIASP